MTASDARRPGGAGRTAYFDCFAGASGDMVLGALVDAGLPLDGLRQALAGLGMEDEYALSARRVQKHGISATKVDVRSKVGHVHRHLSDVLAILDAADLSGTVREKAGLVFRRLAEAEARVHGTSVEAVHFHEVGAVDAIVDVVGAVAGLERLGVTRILTSALTDGTGTTRGAHGAMPIPVPAVAALCQGLPLRRTSIPFELLTPTGAALLTTLSAAVGRTSTLRAQRVGYGAGTRDLDEIPNLLRLEIGEEEGLPGLETDEVVLIESNIDDTTPEVTAHVLGLLMAEGARDAWITPVTMKKGRAAVTLSALVDPGREGAFADLVLRETTTLGVRFSRLSRLTLPRREGRVQTRFGPVSVKIATHEGRERVAPEFDDCVRVARENRVPLQDVYRAVAAASGT